MSTAPNITAPQSLLPDRIENARSLMIVLIIMAFLASLALLFARGIDRLSGDWRSDLSGTATVQIIYNSAEPQDAQMQAAETLLGGLLPNAELTPLTDTAAKALLQPWIGSAELPDGLAVPGLITITDSSAPLPLERIKADMLAAGLVVIIDDHGRFSDGVMTTARKLMLLGMALLVLLLAAGLAVSVFATRSGLSSQRDIIRVLVQVGASTEFIAKLFVGQAGKRGLLGALIGIILSAILWAGLSVSGITSGIGWSGISSWFADLLYLLALGFLFTLICAAAAGITALRQLSKERRAA